VPDGIARQLVYGDDYVVGQLGGKPEFGRVSGDGGPNLVQIAEFESLF